MWWLYRNNGELRVRLLKGQLARRVLVGVIVNRGQLLLFIVLISPYLIYYGRIYFVLFWYMIFFLIEVFVVIINII
jgi:hypothetical protein